LFGSQEPGIKRQLKVLIEQPDAEVIKAQVISPTEDKEDSMAKYYGSECKGDCLGHKAGYRYVKSGGRLKTSTSPSFNKGMAIAQRHLKTQGVTTRLRKPK